MRRTALTSPVLLLAFVVGTPTASATGDDWGLNGRYRATSIGNWAETNDVFHDEASVFSTWTISSTCSTPVECTGRVSSDAGWSAGASIHGSEWVVKRDIPNWEPCPGGAARTGHQIYRFYGVDEKGWVSVGSNILAGVDKTSGDSGDCGINQNLVITMPFRLEKVS